MFKIKCFEEIDLNEKERRSENLINNFEDEIFNLQDTNVFEMSDDATVNAYKLLDYLTDYQAALSSYIIAIKENDEGNKEYYFDGICSLSRNIIRLMKELPFESETTKSIKKLVREEI